LAFIIVAAGPMTACRMRTFSARRVLACATATALVLMACCVTLGYRLAHERTDESATARGHLAGTGLDTSHTQGKVVVHRIGELSGRLTRLEIEAAELARRLRVAPSGKAAVDDAEAARAVASDADDASPRGGPLLPVRDETSRIAHPMRSHGDESGAGLSRLEIRIEWLQTTLDRMTGALADRDLATMAYPSRLPVQGQLARISSGFGVRQDPFTGRLARHTGLDIPAAHGTAILASGGGRVTSAGFRGPYGNAVVIDHGDGLQTLYGHCSKLYVRTGDLVMPQQKIAAVGSTGRSTGPHLHFELIRHGERVAPRQVLTGLLARNSP
jgi:murein DD-endopeptidase MepM/ murein hydrolase activator NlpD